MRSVLAGLVLFAMTSPSAAQIVGHDAVYKIRLAHAAPAGTIEGMSGAMSLSVSVMCDGLTVNQTLDTDFWEQDGVLHAGFLTASSWEEAGGLEMRFSLANKIDGDVVEAFEGEASREDVGVEGTIVYDEDAFPPAPLPAAAIFPGAHLSALVAAAQEGERVFEAMVFDGASEGKIYLTTAIIGPKLSGKSLEPGAGPLEGLARWPVVLSYFPSGSDDPLPEYETSFHLYENGIAGQLLMDYGDFALRGTLEELQIAAAPDCE